MAADDDSKECSIQDAIEHCEFMARKTKLEKFNKKGRQEEGIQRQLWCFMNHSTSRPLSKKGRDNYERIFGHK